MKKVNAHFWIFCAAIFFVFTTILLRAQLPQGFKGNGFQYAYRDPKTLALKAIFTGNNARQITGSQVFVTDFTMKTLRNGDTNSVEVIAQAPECLLDRGISVASSAGPVKVFTVTTNLYIQGVGFLCQQSNSLFVISNNVETIIHKESFATNSAGKNFPQLSATNSTNQILKIFADHFQFLYESNLVTYTGNVRVDDPQMNLTCDLLNIFFNTNRSIHQIFAENHVVILNKKDNSRATGDHAVYTIETNREIVELTGNPFWSDGAREGKADKFVFDRVKNLFRGEQHAVFKMPREKLGQLNLLNSNSPPPTNAPTKIPVVISSDLMTLQFPPTNGPIQEMIAETNVVIFSESDESRATADRAIYRDATGLLELTGNPFWKMKGSEIKAEILVVGKTNHFFSARTNVDLKMPATLFGKTLTGKTNSANTNQIVQVFSDELSYATNLATFHQNVRAKTIDADLSETSLRCDVLQISFGVSNQVETVVANQKVFLQQIPGAAAHSKFLQKSVACDLLSLDRSPQTGLLKNIHAEINVVGEQIQPAPDGKITERVFSDLMDIQFSPTTNQVEKIIAQQNVFAEKIQQLGAIEKSTSANGQRAVYDSTKQIVEMSCEPSAISENMLIHDAITLRWNLNTGKFDARGPSKITPLNPTNNFKLLLKSKPKS